MTYEFHEIANMFPMMSVDEYEQLKLDIAANGLIEPIILYENKILDGRNRWLACGEVNVTPVFEYYTDETPVSYVISKNLHRRHLNKSQIGMIGTGAKQRLAEEAKRRQLANLIQFQNETDTALMQERDRGEAAELAGKALGVSARYIYDAEKIKREAPEYIEPIMQGEKTISQVKRELRRKDRIESTPTIPNGKYNVIYADPPWKYDFGFDIHGAADRHYHTLTIDELCDLPIKELAEDNAVLFMWTTSPKLFDSKRVIDAWGFDYKTSFIWDKVKHVMGHYNSVRHEILLVCVRGSFPKQNNTLHDSVISIERSDEHSEKPEYFRGLIEDMYPKSKRIELFARKKIDGWDTWGNEL